MASGSRKGSAFERLFCRQLSEWWSGGADDDLFWRTQSSGARATVRHKAGKKTRGQYGDVTAADGRGRKLTKLITFSLKRGYGTTSLVDILDTMKGRKDPPWKVWIREAEECAKSAETPFWMIVSKRNQRDTILAMPVNFWHHLWFENCPILRPKKRIELCMGDETILVCRCQTFFKLISPMILKNVRISDGQELSET